MDDTKEMKEWLAQAAKDSGMKIQYSAMMAAIVSENSLRDPLCALQLGYAIFLDKPIVLIVDHKCELPKALVKVVTAIERVDTKNPKDIERAQQAIAHVAASVTQMGEKKDG